MLRNHICLRSTRLLDPNWWSNGRLKRFHGQVVILCEGWLAFHPIENDRNPPWLGVTWDPRVVCQQLGISKDANLKGWIGNWKFDYCFDLIWKIRITKKHTKKHRNFGQILWIWKSKKMRKFYLRISKSVILNSSLWRIHVNIYGGQFIGTATIVAPWLSYRLFTGKANTQAR